MRPQWYHDESDRLFSINRFRAASATRQIVIGLIVVYVLQLIPALRLTDALALDVGTLSNPLQWYRLVTYSFIHSENDPLHLVFNALMLWFFGETVEARLGKRGFFAFCAGAALAGSLAFLGWLWLRGGGDAFMLGASGVAMAVTVAFAVIAPRAEVVFFVIRLPAMALALILVAIDVVMTIRSTGDGVAHATHIGGAAFGFVTIWWGSSIRAIPERWRRARAQAAAEEDQESRREVDRLLAKINESGLPSLTRRERRFLETASRRYRNRR